jgi:hippurate hydrolase
VSITSFRTSSDAYNVIPQKVELRGTVRSLNTGLQDMAEANLTRIAENTAAAFGAVARVSYKRNYPAMVNAAAQTDFAAEVARAVAGDCAEAPLVMGAEDFSFMLNARPGAYILVGNGETASLHHPEYDFDDAVIPAGCSWWAEVVERRMPIG